MKKDDSSHSGHSGLSIALDNEETPIQQSKELFPQHSDNQPDLVHYESELPDYYINDPEDSTSSLPVNDHAITRAAPVSPGVARV